MSSDQSDHYFSAQPASAEERRTITVPLAGKSRPVQVAAGVFSPDRIDQGTSVLLQHAPAPPTSGTFLDLGCGWGPITLTLALRSPLAQVWGVDVNERALDLVRTNAEALELNGIRATTPDQVPADLEFDLIWSNPPIRVGKAVLHELMRTWVPRLRTGGAAYLVVQRNLGSDSLHRWLTDELETTHPGEFTVSRFTSVKGFRILHVARA